jgi:Uma2 family endonuclease
MFAGAPADTLAVLMSVEEWARLPEDEPGEVVDGYLVEEEVPDNIHEIVLAWILHRLHAWGRPRGAVVFGSGAKFAVGANRGRMPDISVFLPGAPKPPKRGLNRAPPSIAIEIVSPSPRDERRDRVEKLREYAAFGVRWYWIVDPELRSFQIHELNADRRYEHAIDVTEGIVGAVPGCEGLSIDVSSLWSEIDALGEDDGSV